MALVPRRERGMAPYEVMLSESQERMLVFPKKEHEEDVRRAAGALGAEGGRHRARDGGRDGARAGRRPEVAAMPVEMLTEPPEYRRKGVRPAYLDEVQAFDLASLPDIEGREAAGKALLRLLSTPELADKRWVWRQYDHQVLTNTVVGPGSDAAVLRVKGTKKGIALTTDGNGLYCYLDPYAGGAIAVARRRETSSAPAPQPSPSPIA